MTKRDDLQTNACPLAKLVWKWRLRTDAARRAHLWECAGWRKLVPRMAGQDCTCMHAGFLCVMCPHGTRCRWCTHRQWQKTTRHQSMSSLISTSERVASGSPVTCIGLNRRVLTWLYTQGPDQSSHKPNPPQLFFCPPTLPWVSSWLFCYNFLSVCLVDFLVPDVSRIWGFLWIYSESCLNLVDHNVFGLPCCHLGWFAGAKSATCGKV